MKAVLNCLVLSTVVVAAIITGPGRPAQAQYIGTDSHDSKVVQATEVMSAGSQASRTLSLTDSAAVAGVNTAGTVRVNMLANLEAVMNIGANGIQIVCMIWGAVLMYSCAKAIGKPNRGRSFVFALLPLLCGICAPASINWVVAACRDASLFS